MLDKITLSIVIPAYNESLNIEEAIHTIHAEMPERISEYEVIIIDDGSKDSTAERIRLLTNKYKNIQLIHHTENIGKGAALRSGFMAARMQWTLMMDSDLQINFSELGVFLEMMNKEDAIIGYRFGRDDKLIRRIVSKVYAVIVSVCFGVNVRDVNCPFKLIKTSIVKKIDIKTNGFAIDVEILRRMLETKCSIKEVAVKSHNRKDGKSSVKSMHIFYVLYELCIIKWYSNHQW